MCIEAEIVDQTTEAIFLYYRDSREGYVLTHLVGAAEAWRIPLPRLVMGV